MRLPREITLLEATTGPGFCAGVWTGDDDRAHTCYLDRNHPGPCICGGCDYGLEHERWRTA